MVALVLQWVVVAALVAGCAAYAAWTLMPAAGRRRIASAAVARRWPLEHFWRRHAQAPSGCGCDGCDAAPLSARKGRDVTQQAGSGEPRPITFHPRR
jgi:hypothetical protein